MPFRRPRSLSPRTAVHVPLILALMVVFAVAMLVTACGGSSGTSNGASTTATPPAAGGAQVSIKGFAFSPASVTIKAGGSVTWTNQDSPAHSITADNGEFDSGNIANGATYSFTFAKAGSYPYHCGIHPSMKGNIIVQ